MGLRDTGGFAFRGVCLGARAAATARGRHHVGRLPISCSIGVVLAALICVTSARAAFPALSEGCASLNTATPVGGSTNPLPVPWTDSDSGQSSKFVSGPFNLNEVMQFQVKPVPSDGSVAFSGIGPSGDIRSESFDIGSSAGGMGSFSLTVTGSGTQTVAISNSDKNKNTIIVTSSCSLPAPKTNQTHNFNATVSLAFTDDLTNDTGQLFGVLFIDGSGDLVNAALTLYLPYSGQDGIYSTSSCNFLSGTNDSTRTLFILDSNNCLYYNLGENSFGVRVYIQTSEPLTSSGSVTLTGASYVGNFGVGGNLAGGNNSIIATSSLTDMHNFNGDGTSDILWSAPVPSSSTKQAAPQSASAAVAIWLMNGTQTLNTGAIANVPTNWSIIGQRDFNGDGNADLLWRDTSGNLAMWFMNGLQIFSTASLGNVPINWSIYGTGDLNGDGIGDLLWRDSSSGTVAVWFMGANGVSSTASLGVVPLSWTIVGDDNKGDIFWRDSSGNLAIWQINGSQIVASAGLGNVPSNWVIAGLGDFNGDGNEDILWRDSNSGTVAIWFLNGTQILSTASLGVVPSTWTIAQTGDYNGDGYSDILWIDSSGSLAVWFMNAGQISSTAGYGNVGTNWLVQNLNAE